MHREWVVYVFYPPSFVVTCWIYFDPSHYIAKLPILRGNAGIELGQTVKTVRITCSIKLVPHRPLVSCHSNPFGLSNNRERSRLKLLTSWHFSPTSSGLVTVINIYYFVVEALRGTKSLSQGADSPFKIYSDDFCTWTTVWIWSLSSRFFAGLKGIFFWLPFPLGHWQRKSGRSCVSGIFFPSVTWNSASHQARRGLARSIPFR